MTEQFGMLSQFRKKGERMLRKWGNEIAEGTGQPNILAMATGGGETDHLATIGASFTPEAEHANRLLVEMKRLDKDAHHYLVAFALQMSLSDMEKAWGNSRSTHNIRLEGALSSWAVLVMWRDLEFNPKRKEEYNKT